MLLTTATYHFVLFKRYMRVFRIEHTHGKI
jgi:hypothetical protein